MVQIAEHPEQDTIVGQIVLEVEKILDTERRDLHKHLDDELAALRTDLIKAMDRTRADVT